MFKRLFGRKKEERSPEEQARELQRLAAAGKKVEAIAIYRELTGVDLAQAKKDIEALIAEAQADGVAVTITNSPDSILDELAKGNKIVAIKMFREMRNVGLKEAKDAIDEVEPLLRYGREEALVRLSEKLAAYPTAAESVSTVDMQMVADELEKGNKINAIKLYREMSGLGLKESKDFVDQLEAQIKLGGHQSTTSSQPTSGSLDPSDMPDVIQALQNKRKIEAIKIYRERTGLGLKEAKDAVDALESQLGL